MLKNMLRSEILSRVVDTPEVIVINGCVILWTLRWPSEGAVAGERVKCVKVWNM